MDSGQPTTRPSRRSIDQPTEHSVIKLVIFLRKKHGMSEDAFKSYYENTHAVLATKTLPQMVHYRRNYLRAVISRSDDGEVGMRPTGSLPFDVMTEQYFRDRSSFDEAMRILSDSVVGQRVADDEEKLFDRSSIQAFLVEECSSEL
jgi:hypothetical protein